MSDYQFNALQKITFHGEPQKNFSCLYHQPQLIYQQLLLWCAKNGLKINFNVCVIISVLCQDPSIIVNNLTKNENDNTYDVNIVSNENLFPHDLFSDLFKLNIYDSFTIQSIIDIYCIDVNSIENDPNIPSCISYTIQHNNFSLFKVLLDNGLDINRIKRTQSRPSILTCRNSQIFRPNDILTEVILQKNEEMFDLIMSKNPYLTRVSIFSPYLAALYTQFKVDVLEPLIDLSSYDTYTSEGDPLQRAINDANTGCKLFF